MPWSLRVRLTFYIFGQYLWFFPGIVLSKIHAKLKASKAFMLFIFLFKYLSLLNNMGAQQKVGNQPCGVSIKTSPCALKPTPAKKKHEVHSETGATVKARCDMPPFVFTDIKPGS
jgi:hypothetical protein